MADAAFSINHFHGSGGAFDCAQYNHLLRKRKSFFNYFWIRARKTREYPPVGAQTNV